MIFGKRNKLKIGAKVGVIGRPIMGTDLVVMKGIILASRYDDLMDDIVFAVRTDDGRIESYRKSVLWTDFKEEE